LWEMLKHISIDLEIDRALLEREDDHP
jgi:hypothetical protein